MKVERTVGIVATGLLLVGVVEIERYRLLLPHGYKNGLQLVLLIGGYSKYFGPEA